MQCGLKSQLAYIYMCPTSVTHRNAIKSQVTFLIRVITMSVRSVYVITTSVMGRLIIILYCKNFNVISDI